MHDDDNGIDASKDYLERGVQTESALNVMQSGSTITTSAGGAREKRTVSPGHKPFDISSSSETQGAYTHPSGKGCVDLTAGVQDPEDLSSQVDLTDSLRILKRQLSEQPRLPSTRTLKSASARIVSLPESAPVYSVKTSTDSITRRVVSLPTPTDSNPDGLPSPCLDTDELLESYEHVCVPRSRVRVETNGIDILHTPSPPSSPDSVVIISDKPQLSEDFLQKNVVKDEMSCNQTTNKGCISWTRSPPRPIPALHGPLSLPYARCPSGAEGTIIEEPENLPRMIWGLNDDSVHSSRSPAETTQSQSTPRKPAPRIIPAPVAPPRFKTREPIAAPPPPVPPSVVKPNPQPIPQPSLNAMPQLNPPRHQIIYEQAQLEQAFSGHGPIDLSGVLRPRREQPRIYDPSLPLNPHRIEGYYGNNEGSADWRFTHSPQDPSKLGSHFADNPPDDDMAEYLRPSMSTSSSLASLSSLASSRSLSTIDSPTIDLRSYPMQGQGQVPHRMTALEIAQNYRQQQLKQNQSIQTMLPTPPSSSSPIWASRVSPHSGSFTSPYSDLGLSPELTMSSNLPAIINYLNRTNLQQLQRQADIPLKTPRDEFPHHAGVIGPKISLGNSPLGTSGSLYPDAVNLQDLRNSVYSPSSLQLDHVTKFLQAQNRTNALGFSPASNIIQKSPSQPRPPPNTPLSAAARTRAAKLEEQRRILSLTPVVPAPPSPQSPDLQPRTRSISLQNPRSIPLTQLIQRRLSSVPEEDSGTLIEYSDMLSPTASPPQRSRSLSTSETPIRKLGLAGKPRPPPIRPLDPIPLPMDFDQGPIQAQNYRQRNARPTPTQTRADSSTTGNPAQTYGSNRVKHTAPNKSHSGSERTGSPHGRNRDNYGRDRSGRGRGRSRRGGRGTSMPSRVNGPERVDGGMTVRC